MSHDSMADLILISIYFFESISMLARQYVHLDNTNNDHPLYSKFSNDIYLHCFGMSSIVDVPALPQDSSLGASPLTPHLSHFHRDRSSGES